MGQASPKMGGVMLIGAILLNVTAAGIAPIAGAEPILWTFDRRAHTGPSQLGLACFPSGRFSLNDIAVPSAETLRAALGEGVSAEIIGMEASLCSAYFGVGKGPSSRITLNVRWHLNGAPCGDVIVNRTRAKNADLRFDNSVFLTAVLGSFNDWKQRQGGKTGQC